MASASSDDARSFGSEPDFSAMASLRVAPDEPGRPSPSRVFDDRLEDTPLGFARAVEEANTTRLAAALEAFEARAHGETDGGEVGVGRDPDGAGPRFSGAPADDASARARSSSHPRRARADRQTTRPVEAQAAEWRDAMPHVRVRGVAMFPELASRDSGDPTRLEGVRFVPSATTKKSAATTTPPGFVASEEAPVETPWLPDVPDATRPGCIDAAREFWAHPADAPGSLVRGVALAPAAVPSSDQRDEETFASDGDVVETFAEDRGRRPAEEEEEEEEDHHHHRRRSLAPIFARAKDDAFEARERRRRAAGVPSADPREVIALDLAFFRGCARDVARDVERPDERATEEEVAFAISSEDEEPATWSDAGSEELRRWEES